MTTDHRTCRHCGARLIDRRSHRAGSCVAATFDFHWDDEAFTPVAPGWEGITPRREEEAGSVVLDRHPLIGWLSQRVRRYEALTGEPDDDRPAVDRAVRSMPAVWRDDRITALDEYADGGHPLAIVPAGTPDPSADEIAEHLRDADARRALHDARIARDVCGRRAGA
jgi:hypothetical protein